MKRKIWKKCGICQGTEHEWVSNFRENSYRESGYKLVKGSVTLREASTLHWANRKVAHWAIPYPLKVPTYKNSNSFEKRTSPERVKTCPKRPPREVFSRSYLKKHKAAEVVVQKSGLNLYLARECSSISYMTLIFLVLQDERINGHWCLYQGFRKQRNPAVCISVRFLEHSPSRLLIESGKVNNGNIQSN